MKRIFLILTAVLCLLLAGTGCSSTSEYKVRRLTAQAEEAYEDSDYSQAVSLYCQVLEADENSGDEVYNNRGMSYYNLGQYETAIQDFTSAIELNDSSDVYYGNRASAYYQLGSYSLAAEDFSTALSLKPGKTDYLVGRGNCYTHLEEYEKALEDYNEAISQDSSLLTAYTNRAAVEFRLEMYEQAAQDYTSCLSLDPENASYYWNRAEAYRLNSQPGQALSDYLEYASLGGELTAEYYSSLGQAYQANQQYDQAADSFSDAVALDPDNYTFYEGRANVRFLQEDYESAVADYTLALEKGADASEDAAVIYGNLGYSYYQIGDLESALVELNLCLQLDGDYAWAYYARGQVYQAKKDYQAAKDDYDKAAELTQTD